MYIYYHDDVDIVNGSPTDVSINLHAVGNSLA